jgi:arylsulfatase A-like enzyme
LVARRSIADHPSFDRLGRPGGPPAGEADGPSSSPWCSIRPIRVRVGSALIYDVTPTVLRLLGLPVPENLEGRVLEGILSKEFRAAHPVRAVATLAPLFDRGATSRPKEDPGQEEMRELLRSLGYLD